MGKRFYNILITLTDRVRKPLSALLFNTSPIVVFSTLLLFTLYCASYLPTLQFDYDIESFFSSDDPEVGFYSQHRDTFENENEFILIGLYNKEGVFQKNFLEKTDSLTKVLKRYDRLEKVFSPTNLSEVVNSPKGSIQSPLIHIDDPEKYATDKSKIFTSGIHINSFFSPDAHSISLLIRKQGDLARHTNDSLLLALNNTINSFNFDEAHIAGRIKTQHYYVSGMRKQMRLFAGLACILFLVSLFIIFLDFRYVLIAFMAVLVSLIWIFGIIGWLGIHLDLMLTLLPALIFIISTSGSIHLITRFRNEYGSDVPKLSAINKAVKETGMPNFLNAFTTAIGFASLFMIPVPPIQRFGLLVALGIVLSFFVTLFLIPAVLKAIKLKPSINCAPTHRKGNKFYLFALEKTGWITGAFSLTMLIGIFYFFQVKINNHFLDDLNPSSSLQKDLDFFEHNFSGIRPFEMNLQAINGKSILNYEALTELDKVEKYLKTEYGVGFLFSPLTFIKNINKAINGGDLEYYKLPESPQKLKEIVMVADMQKIWKRYLPVVNKTYSIGRITGKTKDEGSRVFKKRNEKLQAFLKEHTSHLQYKVTGAAHLMDNANSHMAWNLAKGILLAIIVTTLIIGFYMSSWKLALLSILPNILPLLMISGVMGFAGIPLKVATAIIFTIVYGIAVDDTIHFLNSYRLSRKLHTNSRDAIQQTIAKMWRPMIYTSIVLFSGFIIFTLSEFASISTLGLLVSGSLLLALLSDFLLLPILLNKVIFK